MLSTYGWITPIDAIEHPDLDKHGGLIWFSFADVRPATPVVLGIELTFGLYADIDGLGAEDCHYVGANQESGPTLPLPPIDITSSLPPLQYTPLRAIAKSMPAPKQTPLSGTAKSFTPGLEWTYLSNLDVNADYAHYRPEVLTDCFALNALQFCDGDDTADCNKCGNVSPGSTGTGGKSNDTENVQPFDLDKQRPEGYSPPAGFLPPPGLPPPPGLEDCSSLKIEG